MIAGLFSRHDADDAIGALAHHYQAGNLFREFPFDSRGQWRDDSMLLLQQDRHNTSQSHHENGPVCDESNGLVISAWASLYNRPELFSLLGLASGEQLMADSQLILHCYLRWKEDCVNYLIGDYAFVIADISAQSLFCARDPMGIRPFYYQLQENQFSFASSMGCFQYIPGCDMTPTQQWMAEFMMGLSKSWNTTPYPDIQKLPPAHALIVNKHDHRCYAYFRFNGQRSLTFGNSEAAVMAYKKELDRAILSRFNSDYPLGFELSGGLDSSTITCYAGHYLQGRKKSSIQAFGYICFEQDPKSIHAVSTRYSISATHLMSQDGLRHDSTLRAIKILGYPLEHASSMAHEPFYRLAQQQGIRTLFSGFGGDEFVTCKGNLVLTELYDQRCWKSLYQCQPGNAVTRALRLARLMQHMSGDHKQTHILGWRQSLEARGLHHVVLHPHMERYNLKQRYLAQARYSAGFRSVNEFALNDRWAPFMPTRTETGTLLAAARGVEYRWPLLDHRLIEHFLATPTMEKWYRGKSRYLHRRAVNGIVPHRVAWWPSKDMGQSIGRPEAKNNWTDLVQLKELHPLLLDLVDIPKLTRQQLHLAQNKALRKQETSFQLRRNFLYIHWLNIWLNDYLKI